MVFALFIPPPLSPPNTKWLENVFEKNFFAIFLSIKVTWFDQLWKYNHQALEALTCLIQQG